MTISPNKRIKIMDLRGRGATYREIAQELGICEKTARNWACRAEEAGHLEELPKSGRPRSTTPLQDRTLFALARANETATARELKTRLRLPVSPCTIKRRLREAGFKFRTPRPYVSGLDNPEVREERKAYAREQLQTLDLPKIFVDECTIYANKKYRKQVRVRPHHRGRVRYPANRSRSVKVSVFGGMCRDELLPLYVIFGNLDAAQFKDVLAELYWPVISQKFEGASCRFIMDNCPIHRAELVQDWLDSVPEFQGLVLFQPRYSPDLNPIENLWAKLKKIVAGRIYLTVPALKRAILRAWDRLNARKRLLRQLDSSFKRRLEACLQADGGPTKY